MKRKNKLNLNGIVVINKPKGLTSNRILQELKHLYNADKAGHTGTLDPMATGVLPICFGRATKIAQYLLDADKEYIATIKLGVETDSGDADGQVTATSDKIPMLDKNVIETALEKYRGEIEQTPPMFSALKHNGQPLYKLARAGVTIEIKPRKITIYKLECLGFNYDEIKVLVRSSKGTYIRSLAMDIGHDLGCGAHLIELQRTMSGPFEITKSFDINDLKELSLEEKLATINHVETVFDDKPIYNLKESEKIGLLQKGQLPENDMDGVVRIYSDNEFIAISEFEKGKLISKKFFEQEILISESI